jgi:hypothetical protein
MLSENNGIEPQMLVAMNVIAAMRIDGRLPRRSPIQPQRNDPSTVPVIPARGSSAAGIFPVFVCHAGQDKRQRRRLHHIDRHRCRHHEHERHVRFAYRHFVQRAHPDVHAGLEGVRMVGGNHSPHSCGQPGHYQHHPDDHRQIHRHTDQAEAHVSTFEVHREVQDHPYGHGHYAGPIGTRVPEGSASISQIHS